jgi:predicted Asp-tRNA(Asn)/Glu-tRNA(Gln) amidotransferase subunit C
LSERKLKEIERSAEEMLESFIKAAGDLPSLKETYYTQDLYNIMRPDGEPLKERAEFRKRFIANMPSSDEEGNLRVEVARWVR